jgi:hypothetical protein
MKHLVLVLFVSACSTRATTTPPAAIPAATAAIARDVAIARGLAAPVARDHLAIAFETPRIIRASIATAGGTTFIRLLVDGPHVHELARGTDPSRDDHGRSHMPR